MKVNLLIILIFFVQILNGQEVEKDAIIYETEFGIATEIGMLFTKKTDIYGYHLKDEEKKLGQIITRNYPFAILFIGRLVINESLTMEFKPGFVINKYYYGAELGFYLKYWFFKKYFFFNGGFNIHIQPKATNQGFNNNYYNFFDIGIGVNFYEDINFLFLYSYQKEWNYLYQKNDIGFSFKDLLKFGFEYTF
ncbi:MAG: hypothetical protein H6610_09060 [Ignavibacteriales bacterium]|nr:hypothetical protein [Ignavibacteriales bacterium]